MDEYMNNEPAKDEILSCLDNACHVIHDTPDFTSFHSWWEEHGSGDLGLTSPQFEVVYNQLRVDLYTFDGCLAEYRRLLIDRPQEALQIGDGEYAFLKADGELTGLCVSKDSTIDQAEVYDFDSSAFNTCTGGWMQDTYVQTRQRIAAPVFIQVTANFNLAD